MASNQQHTPTQHEYAFERRITPYNVETDVKLIRASHYRRQKRWDREMRVLDTNHPRAYGIAILNPEIGYQRYQLSDRLEGFQDTAAFHQFIASMDAFTSKARGLFSTELRYSTNDLTVNELLNRKAAGVNIRSVLRLFLGALKRARIIKLEHQMSKLTLSMLKEEIENLVRLDASSSIACWDVLMTIQKPFKKTDELLFMVQLLDGIARERGESALPKHCYEIVAKDSDEDSDEDLNNAHENGANLSSSQNSTLVHTDAPTLGDEEDTFNSFESDQFEVDATGQQLMDMLDTCLVDYEADRITSDQDSLSISDNDSILDGLHGNSSSSQIGLTQCNDVNLTINTPTPSIQPPPEDEFEVESILDCKTGKRGKALKYLVKWKNYDEISWEKVANLAGCQALIETWHRSQATKKVRRQKKQ